MTGRTLRRAVMAGVALALPLCAEDAPTALTRADWGTVVSSTTVNAAAFVPPDSGDDYETLSSSLTRTDGPLTSTSVTFRAPVILPTGVEVVSFTVDACNDTSQAMTAALVVCPFSGTCDDGNERIISPNTGCNLFAHTLVTPLPIQNGSNMYSLRIIDTNGQQSRFRAVRVFWRRRISPLDGTANYTDVPVGHPLRRYIEALGASQIAVACGSGRFCPDNPVTRGQFAVFLARALGLHFPDEP